MTDRPSSGPREPDHDDHRHAATVHEAGRPGVAYAGTIPVEPPPERTELERLVGWLDTRTGAATLIRSGLRKVFPDHWSFLLGEVALFCFLILLATGVFLTFFYTPSATPVEYDGPYVPLRGAEMSAAYESVMRLSFEVRAGLLMRQVHHWTALVFVAIVIVHLSRVFFTGAFRRPREINWLVGFTLLTLAIAEGFTGYSLPDDLLSGTGLRIAYSVAISIPFIGPWFASLLFGGEFPTAEIISRLFVFHVMLLPGLIIGLITVHLGLVFLQKHTQYPGGRATESNVVGRYLWPGQTFRSVGLFFLTAATMTLIAGLVQINPVWAYGPFIAALVSSPAQPDWYIGWLDGALRIFPPLEPTILGVTIPSVFVPGVVIPGILFTIVALWPFLEAWLTKDRAEHHLLDRPWQRPIRTATGLAILAIFGVLTLAGGNDVLAVTLNVPVETLTLLFQVLVLVLPVAVWLAAYRLSVDRRDAGAARRAVGGIALRRTRDGGFEEIDAGREAGR